MPEEQTSDLAAEILAAAIDPSQIPDDNKLRQLSEGASALAKLEVEIDAMEEALKQKKAAKHKLERRDLPELFDAVLTDRIGVPDAHADLVVKPHYYANIASDWDEERRAAAFAELEERGAADIIRCVVSVYYTAGDLATARRLENALRRSPLVGNRTVETKMSVPWATLTSYVKEQVEKKLPIKLDVLGATVGRICKIVIRKGSK